MSGVDILAVVGASFVGCLAAITVYMEMAGTKRKREKP